MRQKKKNIPDVLRSSLGVPVEQWTSLVHVQGSDFAYRADENVQIYLAVTSCSLFVMVITSEEKSIVEYKWTEIASASWTHENRSLNIVFVDSLELLCCLPDDDSADITPCVRSYIEHSIYYRYYAQLPSTKRDVVFLIRRQCDNSLIIQCLGNNEFTKEEEKDYQQVLLYLKDFAGIDT